MRDWTLSWLLRSALLKGVKDPDSWRLPGRANGCCERWIRTRKNKGDKRTTGGRGRGAGGLLEVSRLV